MRFKSTVAYVPLRLASILRQKAKIARLMKKRPVDLVFLHGSLALDHHQTLSDVDIAVLLKNNPPRFKDITAIQEDLEHLLGREDLDLAILNKASPLLWMQVLKNGKVLYASSQKMLDSFRLRTIQRYLATSHLRKNLYRNIEKTVLNG